MCPEDPAQAYSPEGESRNLAEFIRVQRLIASFKCSISLDLYILLWIYTAQNYSGPLPFVCVLYYFE